MIKLLTLPDQVHSALRIHMGDYVVAMDFESEKHPLPSSTQDAKQINIYDKQAKDVTEKLCFEYILPGEIIEANLENLVWVLQLVSDLTGI